MGSSLLIHVGAWFHPGVGGIQMLKQLLIVLLMFSTNGFDLGFDLRILTFLGKVVAFFKGQQFPGHFVLQIVEVLGGQLHRHPSFRSGHFPGYAVIFDRKYVWLERDFQWGGTLGYNKGVFKRRLGKGVIMVYEVDTERIESQLSYLEQCLDVIQRSQGVLKQGDDPVALFSAARALHIGVECVIDVGSTMIDGFIMRDPGGYLDIVDILEDERVVPSRAIPRLKELVRFRDNLARHYDKVTKEDLLRELADIEVLGSYAGWVRDYLIQELGSADHPPQGSPHRG